MRTRMWVFKYSLESKDKHYNGKPVAAMYAAMFKSVLLIDTDESSGGYPYATESFTEAHIWTDFERAKNYNRMFPELVLYELAISLEKSE